MRASWQTKLQLSGSLFKQTRMKLPMIKVRRVNHIVLWVRDLERMTNFYSSLLGLEVAERLGEDAVFLRVPDSDNHHDLGLIQLGPDAADTPEAPHTGLYHVAWEVASPQDLRDARDALTEASVLVGESEHGNSLSLYAKDPEGNEFEIFWMIPRENWNDREFGVRPLDLTAEMSRFPK